MLVTRAAVPSIKTDGNLSLKPSKASRRRCHITNTSPSAIPRPSSVMQQRHIVIRLNLHLFHRTASILPSTCICSVRSKESIDSLCNKARAQTVARDRQACSSSLVQNWQYGAIVTATKWLQNATNVTTANGPNAPLPSVRLPYVRYVIVTPIDYSLPHKEINPCSFSLWSLQRNTLWWQQIHHFTSAIRATRIHCYSSKSIMNTFSSWTLLFQFHFPCIWGKITLLQIS